MPNDDTLIHREEFIYLAGLTETSALIAWGAFYFKVKEGKWELIRDRDLHKYKKYRPDIDRLNLIGSSSKPYAELGTEVESPVEIEFTEKGSGVTNREHYGRTNHVELQRLKPDTIYSYRVKVNGKEWGGGDLRDWKPGAGGGAMVPSGRSYKNEFRTFPERSRPASKLTFAVLGDFGRGVATGSEGELCQSVIAESLERAVDEKGIRLILTTGDNIYNISDQGSGDEDSDWFFTYFQPYRYVLNRVPVFPCIGNHDEGESLGDSSDDRIQLYDNMYAGFRFLRSNPKEAQLQPGLFYRFRFGSDIEFICLDTSKRKWIGGTRYFMHPDHQEFLNLAFPSGAPQPPKWRIPFFHHPPYSAGPSHFNDGDVIEHLVPKFKASGVRAVFCGHEHNFQYSSDEEIAYFVSGGSGKFRSNKPSQFGDAKTKAWGGNTEGHFTMVTIENGLMKVFPYGALKGGNLQPIKITAVGTTSNGPPFEVSV